MPGVHCSCTCFLQKIYKIASADSFEESRFDEMPSITKP